MGVALGMWMEVADVLAEVEERTEVELAEEEGVEDPDVEVLFGDKRRFNVEFRGAYLPSSSPSPAAVVDATPSSLLVLPFIDNPVSSM